MLMLDTWQQTAVFNPADPTQKKIEKYVGIPGQYATFYFNKVKNPGSLDGARFGGPTLLGRLGNAHLGKLGAMPSPFSIMGVITYGAIGFAAWYAGTKTAPGRKVVARVKRTLSRGK